MTKEFCQKARQRQIGKRPSEETKRKRSESLKGHIGYWVNKHHSEETKRKISENMRGEKSHLWKGGISSDIDKRISNFEWRAIRKRIYERDKWTCKICGIHCTGIQGKTKIQCHHIVPYRITMDNDDGNLITLCNGCHRKEENKYYQRLKEEGRLF